MSAMPRWQSNSHAALPLEGLPSEYRFATAPPVVDGARPWKDEAPGVVRAQLSNDERMAATIQRKYGTADDVISRPPPSRKPSGDERPPVNFDRKLSNEERYLKSTVDERVARALNDRKSSNNNDDRGPKLERRVPPRLELSRLFTRRKSSKTSNATSTPSSVVSESFDPLASLPTPGTATHRALRKSRSRDSPLDTTTPRQAEHEYTKIHVRKPPPGIQHWFDGLDDYASTKGHSRQASDDLPAARKARDTFLSVSTGPAAEPHPQPNKALHGIGIPRSPPPSGPPSAPSSVRQTLRRSRTTPGLRPESLHSQFSSATVQASARSVVHHPVDKTDKVESRHSPAVLHPADRTDKVESRHSPAVLHPADRTDKVESRHSPAKRHALPDSIQESVLVLSETDESDLDDQDDLEVPQEARDQMAASIRDAAVADVMTPRAPVTIRNLKNSMNKPLPPIRVSRTTDIEDKSQLPYDDGYSSRTSLLSDLRPLSFRSHVTESTVEEADELLPSPTTSMNLPERAMQQYFSSSSLEEDARPGSSARRWNGSSGPTHKLMAVTPEEADLLSAMRRKRAQMHASGASVRPLTAPTHLRSKSTTPDSQQQQQQQRRRAHKESLSLQTAFPPTDEDVVAAAALDSSDAEPSPRDTRARPLAPRANRSADAVSQVWEDVQDWRRRKAASRDAELVPAALQSRFSPDTDTVAGGSALTRPLMQHSHSDDQDVRRSRTSGSSAARSKSMGRTSSNTDVEQDVLAAWNELGGWRRSAGEASCPRAA